MSLEAFGVKNLRCLTDTGLVPIRRITVLVGKNSSGKSTFLRTFPLLQQSVRTKRNSPILWYGDGHPVDFGSLKEAASHWLPEPSVTFMFRALVPEVWNFYTEDQQLDSTFELTLAGGEIPFIKEYVLGAAGQQLRWSFDRHGQLLSLTGTPAEMKLTSPISLGGTATLLPTVHAGEANITMYSTATKDSENRAENDASLGKPLYELFCRLYKNASSELFGLFSFSLHKEELIAQMDYLEKRGLLDRREGVEVDYDTFISLNFLRRAPELITRIDQWLGTFAKNTAYLAPLRVSAQRAYRVTNIAVDEVDPDGGNLAMFLRSLSNAEVESFATFTRQALGFETKVRTTGMHAEILVRQGTSTTFNNLIDVGFGFSEVLPLAAVVWNSCIRPTIEQRTPVSLVAIEQPELHLHPAHQAKLARMFATAALGSADTKILLETHSESLINGFGKLIHEGVLKADDVQIVLFDQDEDTQQTTVRLAGYRESGALYDWPYGFLSPVAERRAPRAAAE